MSSAPPTFIGAPSFILAALAAEIESAAPAEGAQGLSGGRTQTTSSSDSLHDTGDVRITPAASVVLSEPTAAQAPSAQTVAPAEAGPSLSHEQKPAADVSDPLVCLECKSGGKGTRNLVVCIDGTSNQFSKKNTNVVELYSRLIKDENQLTFYNSGIGTYAEPSWKSWSYRKQVFMNMLDLMFALRLEKIIISAYAWLVDNYEEGDRIYLFGFSRGAYQVRALAAMLDIVGLLHKGNRDQIPFAFELYTAFNPEQQQQSEKAAKNSSHPEQSPAVRMETNTAATNPLPVQRELRDSIANCLPSLRRAFKKVSGGGKLLSKGVRKCTRSILCLGPEAPAHTFLLPPAPAPGRNTAPATATTMQDRFKQTFSRTVKAHFVGAWDTVSSVRLIRGNTLPGTTDGMKNVCFFRHALAMHEYRVKFLPEYVNGGDGPDDDCCIGDIPHTKEVWFMGSHSDIGGGSTVNTELDKFGPALRWMSFEAVLAGLKIEPGPRQWEEKTLVTDSMTGFYKLMEWLPIKRLTYTDKTTVISWPPHQHFERRIRPNQRVHETYLNETNDVWFANGRDSIIERDAYTDAEALVGLLRDEPENPKCRLLFEALKRSESGHQSLVDVGILPYLGDIARLYQAEDRNEVITELCSLQHSLAYGPTAKAHEMQSLSGILKTKNSVTHGTYPFAIRGHTRCVSSVASLSQQLVVSGSYDRTLRIWNIETGEAVGDPLTGHTNDVNCVAVSPNGSLVASGSDDNTIRTWRFDAGKSVGGELVIRADGMYHSVLSVAFSPDGLRIVSGSGDRALRIWDAETGQQVGNTMEGHDNWVQSVAFSPDGARIASGSDDWTVRLWDAGTFQPLGDPLTGHTNGVNSVAFSPNGVSIASGSRDETIRVWNLNTRELMHTLAGHSLSVLSVAFSPSGRHIASASWDGTVRIWHVVNGEAVGVLKGHTKGVLSVTFSPDGTRIASGSWDKTVRIWDRIPVSSTDGT